MHGMVAAGEGGGEGRNQTAQVSQHRVERSGALMLGGEFGGGFVFQISHIYHIYLCTFFRFYPSLLFPHSWLHIS